LANVPPWLRDYFLDTIGRSCNERNRANKRAKFSFTTAEERSRGLSFGTCSKPINCLRELR
jgi:hypothetical protein